MESHAREAGCRLIIDPTVDYDGDYGTGATRARFQTLLEFLQQDSMPGDRAEVVLDRRQKPLHSVTLVGDWFLGEAIAGETHGYRQTIFTRHAATVGAAIEEFDDEFNDLLKEQRIPAASSREAAVKQLKKLIVRRPK